MDGSHKQNNHFDNPFFNKPFSLPVIYHFILLMNFHQLVSSVFLPNIFSLIILFIQQTTRFANSGKPQTFHHTRNKGPTPSTKWFQWLSISVREPAISLFVLPRIAVDILAQGSGSPLNNFRRAQLCYLPHSALGFCPSSPAQNAVPLLLLPSLSASSVVNIISCHFLLPNFFPHHC